MPKFVRRMTKACVANDHGPQVFTLLAVVAGTEDAKKYAGPVRFYDQQLMPLVGANSRDTLQRVRDRAVRSGWLAYTPGRKGVPGAYYVVVPAGLEGFTDAPVDEEAGELAAPSNEDLSARVRTQAGSIPAESRQQAGRMPAECAAL